MIKKAASVKQASSSKKADTTHQEKLRDANTGLLVSSLSGRKRTTSIPNLLKNRPFYIKFF